MNVPFNKPYLTKNEIKYIKEAHQRSHLSGDGYFTKHCNKVLENSLKTKKALLTNSCTAALEMTAIILDLKVGDEVIMPSYTFVSTANAFVLRGAIPVFVDIRPDTLNIDESKIERAITNKTKAIVVVHYAGVSCEMDKIIDISKKYNLKVIEDAAQGIFSTYDKKPLGSIGDFGALSFHETKNIISGEGGALLVNKVKYFEASEIVRDKGTNRKSFLEGHVDKYSWRKIGSSFLPSEITAAFLLAQLEKGIDITNNRLRIWSKYNQKLKKLEMDSYITRPTIPEKCKHNAHMYYMILNKDIPRNQVLMKLQEKNINAIFHYVPLHSSEGGKNYCRVDDNLNITDEMAKRIIRLPLWCGLKDDAINYVVDELKNILYQY
jgi:dTDP-4-amino-4,6-dideoxygalactose transaminase